MRARPPVLAIRSFLIAWLCALAFAAPPHVARAADALETTYAAIQPSLVLIETFKAKKLYALGSGFVVGTRDGHALILTNRHVVADGDNYKGLRQFPKAERFRLTVLKLGTSDDLALLESSGGDAPAVTIAEGLPPLGRHIAISGYPSTQIEYAIHGLGLTPSLHEGTVNALPADGYYVQYDAQTEHGNSGGPLFDVESGNVYAIVDLISTKGVQSNLAIGNPRIRAFLANAHVAFAHAPVDGSQAATPGAPAGASASAASAPASHGSVVAACVDPYKTWTASYQQLSQAFLRYIDAVNKTNSSASGPANNISGIVARISINNEQKAIRSVISAEEPKLDAAYAAVQQSGAAATAAKLAKIDADIKQRDRDAATWSSERASAISGYLSTGFMGTVDPSPYNDAKTVETTLGTEMADLKNGPCT